MPLVREDFESYTPPRWVRRSVARLLASLSSQHVGGLSAIVLTESLRVSGGRTHRIRGRKFPARQCLGFYHARWKGEPPVVLLVVDNILSGRPAWFWWLPFTRDVMVGGVLYHEIGHHLNDTVGSLARGEEASADEWRRRLMAIHARRRSWPLRIVRTPLLFLLRAWKRRVRGARR
jgi:hypothetical protein